VRDATDQADHPSTFIALCAFAGLWPGEAAAVQLGDVDFVGAALAVTRQVQRVNGGAIDVRAPKYGSERVVYLADGLVDLLAQHVADFGTIGDKQWLFTGEGDQPPHQNTVGHWWRKTLRVAGLSDIKLHDLRDSYASGLIAAGCDVVTVQRSLGHEKATTTLITYAHLWPAAEDRTRKAAQSIIDALLADEDPNHNSKIGLYVGAREVADQFAPQGLALGQARRHTAQNGRHHAAPPGAARGGALEAQPSATRRHFTASPAA
jgi:hypothetical protein